MAVDAAEAEKKIKTLRKKLQQIEKLKEKAELSPEEQVKVDCEAGYRAEIATLQSEEGNTLGAPTNSGKPAAEEKKEKKEAPSNGKATPPEKKEKKEPPCAQKAAQTQNEATDTVASNGPSPEQEKQIKNLKKKLREIAKLKDKSSLDATERDKIASEDRYLEEIVALERGETLPPVQAVQAAVPEPAKAAVTQPIDDGRPKDEHREARAAANAPPPNDCDMGLLLGDDIEKTWKQKRKKLREISDLWEKDKLDKLQQSKLAAEPGLIEEIQAIRRQAELKLEERRKQREAPAKKTDAVKPTRRSASDAAWACNSCGAEGRPDQLTEDGTCPKCGSGDISHFAPGRNDDSGDEDEEEDKKAQQKPKSYDSQDLKTGRQKAENKGTKNVLGQGRENPVADVVKPSSAKWPEVKEVLESGDNGVDKSRQKKAICVDKPKMEPPYDEFDLTLLKCSFLTRIELKLPPGVLSGDSFQLNFPGRLTDGLLELILKENKLTCVPPGIQDLQRIRSIDLSHNTITALPSEETWEKLSGSLELLDLSFNKLDTIATLAPLTKLSSLKVDANQLTSLEGVSWKKLKQLSTLTAIDNQIAEIPEAVAECAESLMFFELSDNKIVNVPSAVCDLKKLKAMSITGNPIKDPKVVNNAEKGLKDLKAYLAKVGSKRKK